MKFLLIYFFSRDIVPDIRCLCMSELGEWMKSYPMVFLDDIYLKYLGWTLYDKVRNQILLFRKFKFGILGW